MAQINLADENILKLKQIQNVIRSEDGIDSSIDEALSRVLAFYSEMLDRQDPSGRGVISAGSAHKG